MKKTNDELERTTADCRRSLRALQKLAKTAHPELRRQAGLRISSMNDQLRLLRDAVVSFDATESWRTAYERVLSSCSTKRYLSVAVIRSDNYWQDMPGQASLDFNFRLLEHGYSIQRIFIIDPFFWPPTAKKPAAELTRWILNQHQRGIVCHQVRLTDLTEETELVRDFGIYGTDAVGEQIVDFDGRTQRYQIRFNPNGVREAEETWDRILLYSTTFDDATAEIYP